MSRYYFKPIFLFAIFGLLFTLFQNFHSADAKLNSVFQFESASGEVTNGQAINSSQSEIQGRAENRDKKGMRFVATPLGGGLFFDGVDDFLRVPHSSAIQPKKELTLSVVFKTLRKSKEQVLISTLHNGGFGMVLDGTNLRFIVNVKNQIATESISVRYTLERLSESLFYHAVGTYDGRFLRLYVNGRAVGTPVAFDGDIFYKSETDLCIGEDANLRGCGGTVLKKFSGILDEIILKSSALNSNEVVRLFDRYSSQGNLSVAEELDDSWAPQLPQLVGYWKMNGTVGPLSNLQKVLAIRGPKGIANNSDGNGLSLVREGFQQSMKFDGKDDSVEIPFDRSLAPTSELSVSLLFKTSDFSKKQMLVSKTQEGGYSVFLDGSFLVFRIKTNGEYLSAKYPLDNLSVNDWIHVVGTYDGKLLRIYVNGARSSEDVRSSEDGKTSRLIQYSEENSLCIGRDAGRNKCTGRDDQIFLGQIDEVAVWKKGLLRSEVRTLFGRYSDFLGEECDPENAARTLRVMTYNIRKAAGPSADLSKKTEEKDSQLYKIAEFLKNDRNSPPIVILQEIAYKHQNRGPYDKRGRAFDQVSALAEAAGYPYFATLTSKGLVVHSKTTSGEFEKDGLENDQGLGILSKLRIIDTWASELPLPNTAPEVELGTKLPDDWRKPYLLGRVSIQFFGRVLDIYNVHLTAKAPSLRPPQADFIVDTVADQSKLHPERPVILGGDLNLHPSRNDFDEEAMNTLKRSFILNENKDNWINSIDHIGYRAGKERPLFLRRYHVYSDVEYSDHSPVQATFCLPRADRE